MDKIGRDSNRSTTTNEFEIETARRDTAKKLLVRRGVPSTTLEGDIGFVLFFLGGGLYQPETVY